MRGIIAKHQADMRKGVTEGIYRGGWWITMRRKQPYLAETDPDLMALEEEQIKKRMVKYRAPALGSTATKNGGF